jgi:hypothetical protein
VAGFEVITEDDAELVPQVTHNSVEHRKRRGPFEDPLGRHEFRFRREIECIEFRACSMSLSAFRRFLYLVVICFPLQGSNNCTGDVLPKAA